VILTHAMNISSLSQETYKLLLKTYQDGFLDCCGVFCLVFFFLFYWSSGKTICYKWIL